MELVVPTADDMREFGSTLGKILRGGDLVMLDGPLGAGKTTLTQGIAQGMNVEGRVASPTFTIVQVHRPLGSGPYLVHVDAYRLESLEEIDALDLDTSLDESATVVEWGEGKTEVLSEDRLTVKIVRPKGSQTGEQVDDLFVNAPRKIEVIASGKRSAEVLSQLEADLQPSKS